MKIFWFIIAGIFGGIVGGMGMGGGTVLIPILTIFFQIDQKIAQSINLLVFIPMAIVTLGVYCKKKMVDCKQVLWISIPALTTTIVCSIFVKRVEDKWLSLSFGIFLIVLSVIMLTQVVVKWIKDAKIKKEQKQQKNGVKGQNNEQNQ